MSLAITRARALVGVNAVPVDVEVHIGGGLPSLSLVGLPETAVRESKDRVRAAIVNSGFDFPPRRITINLAPAELPKEGGRYDLAIALGILSATGQLKCELIGDYEFLGELSLGGELRPVRGVLPCAVEASRAGRPVILPSANADEVSLIDAEAYPADSLLAVTAHLQNSQLLPHSSRIAGAHCGAAPDLRDVRGQFLAKRALEVAAAGGHNLLLSGPPGTGKSMLAARLPGLLPVLTDDEAIECAAVASAHQTFDARHWRRRPFRQPHHTASAVALVGGGSVPRPGEVSLAHNGVLFLDELPEYSRRVLEVLREPMENGFIVISRAAHKLTFPAVFQLIAAMNPCPCGNLGDQTTHCSCTPDQIARYRARLSAPFLDRIDMHVTVPRLDRLALRRLEPGTETSKEVRTRVCLARTAQLQRGGKINARLSVREVERYCRLSSRDESLLDAAMQHLHLSARAYHRVLKLARTITDLAGKETIDTQSLTEAIGFRTGDRG